MSPDPRTLVLVALPTGIAAWVLAPAPAAILAVILTMAFCAAGGKLLRFLRAWGCFALYWTAAAALAAWLAGAEPPAALAEAGVFLVRLVAAFLLGALVTVLAPPLALARALAWMMRPLLGKNAALPALAVLLMLGAMKRLSRTAGEAIRAARCRMPRRTHLAQLKVIVCKVLEGLSESSEKAALAVAARRLTDEAVWLIPDPLPLPQWLAAAAIILAEAAASLL